MKDNILTTQSVNQNYRSAMAAGNFLASCLDEAIGRQQQSTRWLTLGGIRVKASDIDPQLESNICLHLRFKNSISGNRYIGFSFNWSIGNNTNCRSILFGDKGLTHDHLLKKLYSVFDDFISSIRSTVQRRQHFKQEQQRQENTKQVFTELLTIPRFHPHQAFFSERSVDLELKQLSPAIAARIVNLLYQWDNEIIQAGEHKYTRRSLQAYAEQIHSE